MKFAITLLVILGLLAAAPASAQTGSGRSLTKILIGGAALAVGTAVAATSSNSTTVTTTLGTSATTSSFSKSQLITGLSIAGVGGLVLWDGLRRHDQSPSTTIGVQVGPTRTGLFVRRTLGQRR